MPFPQEHFDEVCGQIRGRILREPMLPSRDQLMDRERLRPLLDEGWEWLDRERPTLASDSDLGARGPVAASLRAHLRDERDKFGVPIWVFAILLKIAVSLLIDFWLLHGESSTGNPNTEAMT